MEALFWILNMSEAVDILPKPKHAIAHAGATQFNLRTVLTCDGVK